MKFKPEHVYYDPSSDMLFIYFKKFGPIHFLTVGDGNDLCDLKITDACYIGKFLRR